MTEHAKPQVGADAPKRDGSKVVSDVAERVRSFVHGSASRHETRPAGEYVRSEAGAYEVRKNVADQVARRLRSGAHKRGLIGGTLSMVAASYVSRYKETMASHQQMFEHTARAKRGDFEGMTTVDIRNLHENAHKYGTPHVEDIQKAAAGELLRREQVRQREKRGVRHANMAEDHAIRMQQRQLQHEQNLRHHAELVANGARSPKAGAPAAKPAAAHPANSGLMTNAQNNAHGTRLAQLAHQAGGVPAPKPAYKGKLSLQNNAPPAAQRSNMVQIRGKKGGMIEKNTMTGKLHYLGRKAAAQQRTRKSLDAAKARLRGAG